MEPEGMTYASKTKVRISVAATTAKTAASIHSRAVPFLCFFTGPVPRNTSRLLNPVYKK